MNSIDYSKALARDRENFQTTLQRDRAQSRELLEQNEERHRKVQDKQKEIFQRDRVEMQNRYSENIDKMKTGTREEVEAQKYAANKKAAEEQARFSAERSQLRKDFDDRFDGIRESYARAFDKQNKFHEIIQGEQDARYSKNVKRMVADNDKKVGDFQERMLGAGESVRAESRREISKLARGHENNLEDVYRAEAEKRYELRDRLQGEIARSKEAHEAEKDQQQQYIQDRSRKMASDFTNRAADLTREYAKKNDDLIAKQTVEALDTGKKHNEQVSDMRRGYETELRTMEIEKRRQSRGDGPYNDIVKKQQGEDRTQIAEDRIARLNKNYEDARRDYGRRLDLATENYKESLHQQSSEAATLRDRIEQDLRADKIVAVTDERIKAGKTQATQEQSALSDRNRLTEQLIVEKNQSNAKIKELKESFGRSLQDIVLKNEKFNKELKSQSEQDKSKFISENAKQRNEEINLLRRNFNKTLDSTVSDYENRLNIAHRENALLRDELELKLRLATEDSDRKIQQLTESYAGKREADMRATRLLMDQRDVNFKTKLDELSNTYQRKMDQQTATAESKMKTIVSAYETRIKELEQGNMKTMNERDNLHSNEMRQLKSAMEQEKHRLISQYEDKIKQINQSYKEKFHQLNEYKQLG